MISEDTLRQHISTARMNSRMKLLQPRLKILQASCSKGILYWVHVRACVKTSQYHTCLLGGYFCTIQIRRLYSKTGGIKANSCFFPHCPGRQPNALLPIFHISSKFKFTKWKAYKCLSQLANWKINYWFNVYAVRHVFLTGRQSLAMQTDQWMQCDSSFPRNAQR